MVAVDYDIEDIIDMALLQKILIKMLGNNIGQRLLEKILSISLPVMELEQVMMFFVAENVHSCKFSSKSQSPILYF